MHNTCFVHRRYTSEMHFFRSFEFFRFDDDRKGRPEGSRTQIHRVAALLHTECHAIFDAIGMRRPNPKARDVTFSPGAAC